MFKGTQIWLMTFLDLLVLMVCFFVLFYSLQISNMSKNNLPTVFEDSEAKTETKKISAALRLIYDSLDQVYSKKPELGKIELDENNEFIRIIPKLDIENLDEIEKISKDIADHIFNFTKNNIKISLMINYEKLLEDSIAQNITIDTRLRNISKGLNEFRNYLAKSANNETIEAYINMNSYNPAIKDKEKFLSIDILPEAN